MGELSTYHNRILDIIIRCSECSNTRALDSFKVMNLHKLICSNCQSNKFKIFLPFRYKFFYEDALKMSGEIYRDNEVLEAFGQPTKTSLVPDFVTDFVKTIGDNEELTYQWNKFDKLPLVLYADSSKVCEACQEIFTQVTLKDDEILDSINVYRKSSNSQIQFQLMYCKCDIKAEIDKRFTEWLERENKYFLEENIKSLTKQELKELGYHDDSPLLAWDEENEEWTSASWIEY